MLQRKAERRAGSDERSNQRRDLSTLQPGRKERGVRNGADQHDLFALAEVRPWHSQEDQRRIGEQQRTALRADAINQLVRRGDRKGGRQAIATIKTDSMRAWSTLAMLSTGTAIQNHRGGFVSTISVQRFAPA